MKNISIHLAPNQLSQIPMRDILGMNNSPTITSKSNTQYEKPFFDALNLAHLRFHDAALSNAGQQLIDIHRIFPLFHLDETDPRNYFFAQTDDYLRVIADGRAEIDFKLGESIDHSENGRLIDPPEDPDKWARICRNIIGHYKNGETDGMHLNITRVTVWEEPDGTTTLFRGTVRQYAELFCKVYKLLKAEFPDLKIGGPSSRCGNTGYISDFLTICQEQGVMPDYITTTMYLRDIPLTLEILGQYRELIDRFGGQHIPCSFGEWHFGPEAWAKCDYVYENGMYTTQNAAFTTASLIALMDVPYLDTVYYYAWGSPTWGVQDKFSTTGKRMLPVYYGLLLYQKLATECDRIAVQTERNEGIYTLAGKTRDGKTRLLIACYEAQPCSFTCTAENTSQCKLYSVKEPYCVEDATIGTALPVESGTVTVSHNGRNGVYLLEFDSK